MTEFKNNNTEIIFNLDIPIYEAQANILNLQLKELDMISRDAETKIFFKYFKEVKSNCFNSFVFAFDDNVLKLNIKKKCQIEETLHEILSDTDWFYNMMQIKSIEDEINNYTKKEIIKENLVNEYLNCLLSCGYKLSYENLDNVFGNLLSREEIEKFSISHRIKIENWIN